MLALTAEARIVVNRELIRDLKIEVDYHEQIIERLSEAVKLPSEFRSAWIQSLITHRETVRELKRRLYAAEDVLLELGIEVKEL